MRCTSRINQATTVVTFDPPRTVATCQAHDPALSGTPPFPHLSQIFLASSSASTPSFSSPPKYVAYSREGSSSNTYASNNHPRPFQDNTHERVGEIQKHHQGITTLGLLPCSFSALLAWFVYMERSGTYRTMAVGNPIAQLPSERKGQHECRLLPKHKENKLIVLPTATRDEEQGVPLLWTEKVQPLRPCIQALSAKVPSAPRYVADSNTGEQHQLITTTVKPLGHFAARFPVQPAVTPPDTSGSRV